MSWQAGQSIIGGPQPLGSMMAAVLLASQKPLAEEALKQVHAALEKVPTDLDWLAFQAGVARYAAQEPRPERAEYPVLATAGRVVLRDAGGAGVSVVLVPSMVNRGYILDLCQGHSLVEFLRENGCRVLLVDWGTPPEGAPGLTLENTISDALVPLIRAAVSVCGGPVSVCGYCMGGLLALAAAVLLGAENIGRLAVAAMPWDFAATASQEHVRLARPVLEPWLQNIGAAPIPAAVMQQYFYLLDPWSPVRRLSAYGRAAEGPELAYLTALEDWLADGLPLDAPVAREMLLDWYADNAPLLGNWRVGGQVITPQALQIPVWAAMPQKDVLVPPLCSLPFAAQVPGIQVHMASTGHVGLVCGRQAVTQFYQPLRAFLGNTT